MFAGGAEAVRFWIHSSVFLFRAGSPNETPGSIYRVEGERPSHAKVGLDHGLHRVGRGKVNFGNPFFRWLRDQILMVEDYAYVSTNFSGDPDLLLPHGG